MRSGRRAGILLKPHGTPGQAPEGLTPISCHAVLERSACAPFIKERRMECINATSLRRKSGRMGHPTFVASSHAGSQGGVRWVVFSNILPWRGEITHKTAVWGFVLLFSPSYLSSLSCSRLNVVQHSRCSFLEVYVSLRLSCWVVFALLFIARAPAQETRVVLDRGGSTIVLEPYAPNIIRVTLSLLKEPALAPPGYGFTATAFRCWLEPSAN